METRCATTMPSTRMVNTFLQAAMDVQVTLIATDAGINASDKIVKDETYGFTY